MGKVITKNVKVKSDTTPAIPERVKEEQGENAKEKWEIYCKWAQDQLARKRLIVGDGKDFFGAGSHTREAMIHFVLFFNSYDYDSGKALPVPAQSSAGETTLRVQALQACAGAWVKGEVGRVSSAGAVNAHRASLSHKYYNGVTQTTCAPGDENATRRGEGLTPSAMKLALENYAQRGMIVAKKAKAKA